MYNIEKKLLNSYFKYYMSLGRDDYHDGSWF